MNIRSLPALDRRYWVGMLIASLAGTTLGDFVSTGLNFGFVKGLLPLSLILIAVFVAEWKTRVATEGYYWAAIVLTRTIATNLADLATHGLGLDYAWLEVALFALLMATALLRRPNKIPSIGSSQAFNATPLSSNGVRYWVMVLVASIIGTTIGDFVSGDLGLGLARACILLGSILVVVLFLQTRLGLFGDTAYWSILIVVRTTGTVMGDFLSGEEGANLGFLLSAACTALLLAGVLGLWRPKIPGTIPDLPCDDEGETAARSQTARS
ncbi:MAG: hypothetical protein ACLPX9_06270 [Rhodomicrobium sp.]